MKKRCLIGALLLTGCFGHFQEGVKAHVVAQEYLEAVYGQEQITGETIVNDILVKDYLNPSEQKQFQKYDCAELNLSAEKWAIFSQNINNALGLDRRCAKGMIAIDRYSIKDTIYTTAFVVDSSSSALLATIPLLKLQDTVGKNK